MERGLGLEQRAERLVRKRPRPRRPPHPVASEAAPWGGACAGHVPSGRATHWSHVSPPRPQSGATSAPPTPGATSSWPDSQESLQWEPCLRSRDATGALWGRHVGCHVILRICGQSGVASRMPRRGHPHSRHWFVPRTLSCGCCGATTGPYENSSGLLRPFWSPPGTPPNLGGANKAMKPQSCSFTDPRIPSPTFGSLQMPQEGPRHRSDDDDDGGKAIPSQLQEQFSL
ncbi:uncharacterized protein LOC116779892 [Chiroxiphia lanceolata]|uniref:uncharacterized protein LOC116779892 n=1 Tax=Chiroxiphia lanceolata TaxID=296741 RepID=UPI0013CEE440|nr:uncharacterized protein LOC116779892 [Chiroxiphia lanceolata]